MNRNFLRTAAERAHARSGTSQLWEHVQIDIPPVGMPDGRISVYFNRSSRIGISALVQEGRPIDFVIEADGLTAEPTEPPFDVAEYPQENDEPGAYSPIYRSWNVSALGLTLHVEAWIEEDGGGFIDLFTRVERKQ